MNCARVAIRSAHRKVIAVGLVLPLVTSSLCAQDDKFHLSREQTLAIESGRALDDGAGVLVSRELQLLVDTSATPAPIQELTVTLLPDRKAANLDWSRYNEIVQHDVIKYKVFMAAQPLYDVQGLEPHRTVPAGTRRVQVAGLDPTTPTYFAVVAVDSGGRLETGVHSVGAYPVFPATTWRELTLMVGDELGSRSEKVFSRELGLLVGGQGHRMVLSRELAILNTTGRAPEAVTSLRVARSVTGDRANLDWSDYREVAQKGLAVYRLFQSDSPFETVEGLKPFAEVPAGTTKWEVRSLDADHNVYFAVVPVSPGGRFSRDVRYAGGYKLAPRVSSREVGLVVDGVSGTSHKVVSRELSIVRPDQTPPAMLTGLTANGARIGTSVLLDWSAYGEVGQNDVHHYRIYGESKFFETIKGLEPLANVPAGVSSYLVRSLKPGRRVYFAVVAEDVLGNVQSSVRCVAAVPQDALPPPKVTDLRVASTATELHFTWRVPDVTHDLSAFRVRFENRPPVTLPPDVFEFQVSGLHPATSYEFQVSTVDALSNESGARITTGVTMLAQASAQQIAASRFENSTDGWTLSNNRGSKIELRDKALFGIDTEAYASFAFTAPAKFVQGAGRAYGGALSFELKQGQTGKQYDSGDVWLKSANMSLAIDAGPNPATTWTSYRVVLHERAGWMVIKKGKPDRMPTPTEFRSVLRGLKELSIRGEFQVGSRDKCWLRNVVLTGVNKIERTAHPKRLLLPRSDWFEPNGMTSNATPVVIGRRVHAQLTQDDIDIFHYDISHAGTFLANVDQLKGLVVEWTDHNGRALSKNRHLVLSGPANVFLRIGLAAENRKETSPYSLQVLRVGTDPTRNPGLYPRHPPPLRVRQLSEFVQ